MGETNWTPAIIALAAGVIGGLLFLLRTRSAPRAATLARSSDRSRLEARFDELIAALRQLRGAGDPAPVLALELEAATLLRELETATPAERAAEPRQPVLSTPAKALLWITGICSVAAVTYLLLLTNMGARPEGAPLTGDQSLSTGVPSARIDELRRAVMANPRDVASRLALARALLDEGRMVEVWEQTEAVLAQDPENARAMAYGSLVLLSAGNAGEAEALARRAVTTAPGLVEGWVHLALVHFQQGRLDEALGDLTRAREASPGDAPLLDQLANEMRRSAANASSPVRYAGMIRIDPQLAERHRGGTIFVVVRDPAASAGPPVAAARLRVTSDAVPFTIRDSDSMTGAPIPQRARLEFRIDTDGDPLTRDDGPSASAEAAEGSMEIIVQLVP